MEKLDHATLCTELTTVQHPSACAPLRAGAKRMLGRAMKRVRRIAKHTWNMMHAKELAQEEHAVKQFRHITVNIAERNWKTMLSKALAQKEQAVQRISPRSAVTIRPQATALGIPCRVGAGGDAIRISIIGDNTAHMQCIFCKPSHARPRRNLLKQGPANEGNILLLHKYQEVRS